MVAVWLEVHSIISTRTNRQKGIDDFARAFLGGASKGPELKPYSYQDVVSTLNTIAAYDWDAFFKTRVYSVQPDLTAAGFEAMGWRIVYDATPNDVMTLAGLSAMSPDTMPLDLVASIGLIVRKESIDDVVPGSPADKAGLMPEAKILAVNGRAFSVDALKDAVSDTAHGGPLELTVNNRGLIQRFTLEYTGGARYPHLQRMPERPDLLTAFGNSRRLS
jgi:predicted metalloprotease with PDZ domain